ncbi:tyrosine-type recombinase/integrase [Acidocella facilis]|uniref:tyrosine-type recombinase/integrase n=1 Tax=Acidocella facilis TaxID=525 RepID=UPI001F1C0B24|nr:site-specific integrase [Acidocella facilis]
MAKKLTALQVKHLIQPGYYADGGGLYFRLAAGNRRSWLFRYKKAGREHWLGLGPADDVTLAKARDKAAQAREMLRAGLDPLQARRDAQAAAVEASEHTFERVAQAYIAAHGSTWKSEKHRWQWARTLEMFAYPTLATKPVNAITSRDVLAVIEPIWTEKPETAARVRGRIETVLDYATARHLRTGDNPARWKGHLQHALPARNKVARVEHHAALPWREVGAFMAALVAENGAAALALRFAILTAARTGEALGATWAEIDMGAAVWTVPAERMKAGREHRVALSPQALHVLKQAEALRIGSALHIFPGAKAGKPLSNMAMLVLLRRMNRADLTTHGFRSTFRDWAAESTSFPREICESALAHTIKSKVEAAYLRGDHLEKRRKLMQLWAAHCSAPVADEAGVIRLRRPAG